MNLIKFFQYLPESALFLCGALFGATAGQLWRECRRYGQMSEHQLLHWQNVQLLNQVEQALQNSSRAVAQQRSGGGALLAAAVSRSEDD